MAWVVTLQINDCSNGNFIPGAVINDGYSYFYADSNGQFIAIIDDFYTAYVVAISKSGFLTRNFTFSQNQNGTIQTTCLNPKPPPKPGNGNNDCFIATAATGSSQSEEVKRLRRLRDSVSAKSRLAADLIDAIYGEYYGFSPAIAAQLQEDTTARQAVLGVVVKPLVAWYALAGKLGLAGADQDGIDHAVRDVASACPRYLASPVAGVLRAINSNQDLPAHTPQILLDFVPKVREAARLPLASWAILDPLMRLWTCAAQGLDIVDEVAHWLAAAPLSSFPAPGTPQLLEEELRVLASFLAFHQEARRELGESLVKAWPDATDALARADMIPQPRT